MLVDETSQGRGSNEWEEALIHLIAISKILLKIKHKVYNFYRDIIRTKSGSMFKITFYFRLMYDQKEIPEQWKVSKTMPMYEKSPQKGIENYRPIANLCSASKVFENLI